MAKRGMGTRGAFLVWILSALLARAGAMDSISLEAGGADNVQMARVDAEWNWTEADWWQSNGSHIGGYWDVSFGQWQLNRYQGGNTRQNLLDLGLTPVFRWQRDDGKGVYAEAGVGLHAFSHAYDNDGRREGAAYVFGDHVGLGYVFANDVDFALKFQHFSNGGLTEPNSGVNLVEVKLGIPLK